MTRNAKSGWKLERASVSRRGHSRPRSNKYSHSDSHGMPAAGSRSKVWVGGYTRGDGTSVRGHFRMMKSSNG